ncbi:hypothetical protein BC833DRAFT_599663 [Globomyces pollinis-pini]|nr:hypothetical protein BC833DRAFT_599663 [Globomyces pollinis-pini]
MINPAVVEEMDVATVTKDTGSQLDRMVKQQLTIWICATAGSIVFLKNNPDFGHYHYNRGSADMSYIFAGIAFFCAAAMFFMTYQASESKEKKSIAFALASICTVLGITDTFILPGRMSIVLKGFNGQPVDVANWLEQLLMTPILIEIIAEYTKTRRVGTESQLYNSMVYIFGFLSTITKNPFSAGFAWISVSAYGVWVPLVEKMHLVGASGETGATMSRSAIWWSKILCYMGNHGVAIVWGLQRFHTISYETGELWCQILQMVAKIAFGSVVLMGLKDEKQKAL